MRVGPVDVGLLAPGQHDLAVGEDRERLGYRDPLLGYNLGGLPIAYTALDSLRRQLACELGPSGAGW